MCVALYLTVLMAEVVPVILEHPIFSEHYIIDRFPILRLLSDSLGGDYGCHGNPVLQGRVAVQVVEFNVRCHHRDLYCVSLFKAHRSAIVGR